MIALAVNGCRGKMGKRLIALAAADPELSLVSALEQKGHPELNLPVGNTVVSDDLGGIEKAEVVIDFTSPQASMDMLEAAVRYKKALVIGTTGLSAEQIARINTAAKVIPIVYSPNMSVGVNLLFRLVKEAAEKLKDYRVCITEAHHIHKKDAPSGTAKKLAEIIENQTGVPVNDIRAIREGEIVGDHEIRFESDVDTLVLSHSAVTRDIFTRGALQAAKWVARKPAGIFTMQDVLGA
ncbi:MAG: 4-hydroxy-tetrahydrodipicolinate reductase [Candidatus Omnitrophica bacterium]|nr:4-hydroxy-tetrahydrodipicolinate reductase [Candidatus Omnitrophota bacterium]